MQSYFRTYSMFRFKSDSTTHTVRLDLDAHHWYITRDKVKRLNKVKFNFGTNLISNLC